MKSSFEIFPQAIHLDSDGQRRHCIVKQTSAKGRSNEKKLWFLYPSDLLMPDDNNCDAYLLAALMPAMQCKADITVHGSVSSALLANLTELQHVWKKWCPEQYSLVAIKVAHERDDEARVAGAISAFSGGVDAQFTAYRHAKKQASYRTQELKAGVLVHGFDIPLDDEAGFTGAERSATETLDDLGIRLITVRTNISKVWPINWEFYSGTAIAAVLCGLSGYAGTGLIGSSDAYDELFAAWGSHPITDPLLSSGSFRVIHDGAGFCRLEKIKALSKWPIGMHNLRVCWQGLERDRNCGSCEKCVRTRLNFLIAGVADPACFSTSISKAQLKNIRLTSKLAISGWEAIRDEMIDKNIDDDWVAEVEKIIKRPTGPAFAYLFPPKSPRRLFIKKMRDKLLRSKSQRVERF